MRYQHPQFPFSYKRPWALQKAWLQDKGFFRRLARYSAVALLAASLAALNIFLFHLAHASSGYAASDVIGQRDETEGIDFNSGDYAHDVEPNNIGNFSSDMALDSVHHRLFNAVCGGIHRIEVWNLDSNNNIAGNTAAARLIANVIGQPDFSSDNNTVDQYTADPCAVAYDPNHNRLFAADSSNNRILVYDLSSGITNGMAASYVLGQTNFTSSGASLTQDGFNIPKYLAYDATNNRLFVADNDNDRILIYDMSGTISNDMNASYVLGQPDFTTNANGLNCGGSTPGPSADSICLGNDVGQGSGGGLAYDESNSRLFVADELYQRVMIFNVSPDTISNNENADYVLGQPNFTTSGCRYNGLGTPDGTTLCAVDGLIYDPDHKVLFAGDNNRALVFNVDPMTISNNESATYVLGQPDFTTRADYCLPSYGADATTVCGMSDGVYDPAHNRMWEYGNIGIRVFDFSGGITTDQAASDALITLNGGLFTPNFQTTEDDENMVDSEGLEYPSASAIDTVHHRLFVGDYRGILVYQLDNNNDLTTPFASYILGQDRFQNDFNLQCSGASSNLTQNNTGGYFVGLEYDSGDNRLFVADGSCDRVLVFDFSGGLSTGMGASYVIGQPDFTSANGCSGNDGASLLCEPQGLAYDSTNKQLFVSDGSDDRVMVYDLSGGITNGMAASYVLGEPDFNTDTGCDSTTASGLCFPMDLAYSQTAKQLFVADASNDRVLDYDLSGGINNGMPASHVLGQPDFSSSASNTTQNGLDCPDGLGFDDANQHLFVGDECDSRVVMYNTANISNGENASFILGQTDFSSSDCNASQVTLCDPEGHIAYNSINHRLYIPDSSNNRTMIYDFAHITTASLPGGSVGNGYSQTVDKVGGQGSQSFNLSGGSLPAGLSLNSTSGNISGTPSAGGTYNFTIQLADNNGSIGTYTDAVAYSLNIAGSGGGSSSSGGGSSSGSSGGGSSSSSSSSGGGSSSSTGGSSSSSSSASSSSASSFSGGGAISAPVDLDSSPPVTSANACSGVTQASAGQVFTFTEPDGSHHKVTVLQVGADSIEIQIDNLPKTLRVGDLISQDVNGDGVPDICIDVLSITNGKVGLDIARIVLAIAPGNPSPSGHGAGSTNGNNSPPQGGRGIVVYISKFIVFIFPWLLFALLGLTAARLMYLAYQERRAAGRLEAQLAKEEILSGEKSNFITLSSHYLRTPVTAISGGIELMESLAGNNPNVSELKALSQKLTSEINDLLARTHQTVGESTDVSGNLVRPGGQLAPQAAGFIRTLSLPVLIITVLVSYAIVGLAYAILKRIDLYDANLVNFLTELAAVLLAAALTYGNRHSLRRRQQFREEAERRLAQQRRLDSSRSRLVKDSLAELKPELAQLKSKLQSLAAANPKAAQPALNGIAQLESLFNKFTILSSLEGGAMQARKTPLRLDQLVKRSLDQFSNVTRFKNLRFSEDVAPLELNQDNLLLSFVLDSLISNAIKYSPPGSEIALKAKVKGSKVRLAVHDHGTGIAESRLKQLFEPFSRAENTAIDFNFEGAGLSLYLDKLIMQYLDGEIGLDSQAGQGTTVQLELEAI